MIITKRHLPRRTVLRGAGATLALPLLDAMVPAFAAPRPVKRASMFFCCRVESSPSSFASTSIFAMYRRLRQLA